MLRVAPDICTASESSVACWAGLCGSVAGRCSDLRRSAPPRAQPPSMRPEAGRGPAAGSGSTRELWSSRQQRLRSERVDPRPDQPMAGRRSRQRAPGLEPGEEARPELLGWLLFGPRVELAVAKDPISNGHSSPANDRAAPAAQLWLPFSGFRSVCSYSSNPRSGAPEGSSTCSVSLSAICNF